MSQQHSPIAARALPEKPNLNQLKKQAKELLNSFRAGEPETVAEVRTQHGAQPPGPENFHLSDAQRVIARTYGFASWPKLKAFVDGVTVGRFMAAVQAGDLGRVGALLRQRPELVHMDTAGNNEHRGLHYAVLRRDPSMVRLLMQSGADARKGIWPHRDATTAFALAKDRDYLEIVAVLEEEEQRRREQTSCPNVTVSPAQDLINEAVRAGDNVTAVRMLEADTGLVHACDRSGGTLLHAAAQAANEEMVAWLLARGAGVHKKDLRGFTPLDRAALAANAYNGRAARFPTVAKLLLDRGAEVTLPAAIALGDISCIRELVEANPGLLRQEIRWTEGGLLTLAVKHGQLEVIRLLLDLGMDVDERTMLQELEEPTLSWGAPLWHAAWAGRCDIAELLLDRGADPNANLYASGWPLSRAYERGDEAMKQLLIARGARAEPHLIAQAHDVAAARRLLDTGVREEVVQDLCWSACDGGCPAIVELALPRLKWPANDPRWNWYLIQPVRSLGDDRGALPPVTADDLLRCLELLMRYGVDPNVARMGQTALHFTAARHGVPDEADRVRFAAMLVDHGARLDLRDDLLRSTPLGWACRWGRLELTNFLIGRGAPVNEPDAEPWATPLAWARKMGHETIESRLQEAGAEW
ncbi:MAG TPA: ankyrin repeat domain-containing protein [Terriglobia bacterium]|nr:ankyrin repeat domain-containing protein [Terriglobia bacterium]